MSRPITPLLILHVDNLILFPSLFPRDSSNSGIQISLLYIDISREYF